MSNSFYDANYRFPSSGDSCCGSMSCGFPTIPNASAYALDEQIVLSGNTLGPSITNSSLTSFGPLSSLNVSGDITCGGRVTCEFFTVNQDLTLSGNLDITGTVDVDSAATFNGELTATSGASFSGHPISFNPGTGNPTTFNTKIDLTGNGIFNVSNIDTANAGADNLTFNAGGNGNYSFNTTASNAQTMRIKDNDNDQNECVVRVESGNGEGIVDVIADNDGHVGLFHRQNSNPGQATNYMHFGVENAEKMRITPTEITIPSGVVLNPLGGISGLHGEGEAQFIDTTVDNTRIDDHATVVVLKYRPFNSTLDLILPSPRTSTNGNRKIYVISLNETLGQAAAGQWRFVSDAGQVLKQPNAGISSAVQIPTNGETHYDVIEGKFTSTTAAWYIKEL
jgi:hypothetical protein